MCKRCKHKSSTPHHLHQCFGCWEEVFILSTPFILDCLSCWPTSCWDPSAKVFSLCTLNPILLQFLSLVLILLILSLWNILVTFRDKKTLVRVQKKTMFWLKTAVFFPALVLKSGFWLINCNTTTILSISRYESSWYRCDTTLVEINYCTLIRSHFDISVICRSAKANFCTENK